MYLPRLVEHLAKKNCSQGKGPNALGIEESKSIIPMVSASLKIEKNFCIYKER